MKPLVSMREALADDALFGAIMADDSWHVWRILLIAMLGEPLTAEEREVFTALTNRDHEPLQPVEEFWGIVGRRGGKTRAAALLSTYLAALCDWKDILTLGERGRLFYMAHTAKQGAIAFGYAKAIFTDLPLFRNLLAAEPSNDCINLTNSIDLEVRAATWRGIRGVTAIGAIFDELAFFRNEDNSANADREILAAMRPALATTGGPLIAISSPFAKRGEVYEIANREHNADGDKLILVARGSSRTFNPSLPQRVVDRALQRDPAAARAEYLGEFRDDLAAFVDRELVEACIMRGVSARMPNKNVMPYVAFCDPSGGSADSMTLAIGHDERNNVFGSKRSFVDGLLLGQAEFREAVNLKDKYVLDRLIEVVPPFRPELVVQQFADVLKSYGVKSVYGDNYGAAWVRDAFNRYGISYNKSKWNRSELFLNFLPLVNSRSVILLDEPKMVSQLSGLQRRVTSGGRENIDHVAGGHDDVANAAAGCISMIAYKRNKLITTRSFAIPV